MSVIPNALRNDKENYAWSCQWVRYSAIDIVECAEAGVDCAVAQFGFDME